jgi:ABC-type enterochelin transport system permease subunit
MRVVKIIVFVYLRCFLCKQYHHEGIEVIIVCVLVFAICQNSYSFMMILLAQKDTNTTSALSFQNVNHVHNTPLRLGLDLVDCMCHIISTAEM